MSVREQIVQAVENLDEAELQQVAEYLAFLKYRARVSAVPTRNSAQVAALYAQFAEEDRDLAEDGMAEYNQSLLVEDTL